MSSAYLKDTVNELQFEVGWVSWWGGLLSQCLWFAGADVSLFQVLHRVGLGSGHGLQEDQSRTRMNGIGVEYHVVGQDHQHNKDHKFIHRLDALGSLQNNPIGMI